jgi:hypothetical protein
MITHAGSCGVFLLLIVSGCVNQQGVSYREDVVPIMESKCVQCHLPPDGAGYLKTGLNLASYESLMQGTIYGPVIVPGDSRHSVLNMVVEGRLNRSMRAPYPLTDEELAILRLWVEQGAKDN